MPPLLMSGAVPLSIGLTPSSGMRLGIGGATGSLNANISTTFFKKAARVTKRATIRRMLKGAPRRFVNSMAGKHWKETVAHLMEHFSVDVMLQNKKARHGVWDAAFRNMDKIKKMVRETALGPGHKYASTSVVSLSESGCTILERKYAEVIGTQFVLDKAGRPKKAFKMVKKTIEEIDKKTGKKISREVEEEVEDAECRILRVIITKLGKIRSAYPIRTFGE